MLYSQIIQTINDNYFVNVDKQEAINAVNNKKQLARFKDQIIPEIENEEVMYLVTSATKTHSVVYVGNNIGLNITVSIKNQFIY